MIAKLPVLSFTLVTALSGAAMAHEPRGNEPRGNERDGHERRGHDSYVDHRHTPPPRATPRNRTGGVADLRRSDINGDGWVALGEALGDGRRDFDRTDRDRNQVLTRRELGAYELDRDDRNRDGRVTKHEHQSAVRARFAHLDRNRDGFLARYELEPASPPLTRRVGWRR